MWEYVIPFAGMSVSDWWARFGWDDWGDDWDEDWDENWGEDWKGDWDQDDFMAAQAAFRATRIAPDHPGLARLGR